MESSTAEFLLRQDACELLPTTPPKKTRVYALKRLVPNKGFMGQGAFAGALCPNAVLPEGLPRHTENRRFCKKSDTHTHTQHTEHGKTSLKN